MDGAAMVVYTIYDRENDRSVWLLMWGEFYIGIDFIFCFLLFSVRLSRISDKN